MTDRTERTDIGTSKTKKKWLSTSNISTAVFALFIGAMIFSPDFKSYLIRGLMHIGLFQPDMPEHAVSGSTEDLTAPRSQALLKDVKGQIIDLSDLRGKVVFVNFWATWCPPCIAEMPSINTLYHTYRDNKNVVFLLVDVDSEIEASTSFMKSRGWSLPVYVPASRMPEAYFSGSMPTTVILDKSGNIAFHHVGGADYANSKVTGFIDKLIKLPSQKASRN